MLNKIIVKCRRIYYSENKFFPKESIFTLDNLYITEIVNWYKENIMYYEKRDSLERKAIPLVSVELFEMLFVARLTAINEDINTPRITVEINNECVYIGGPKTGIQYPKIFDSDEFRRIWEFNDFKQINFIDIFVKEKSNRRVSIIFNSIYLNFKSRARNNKFFQKADDKYSDKELIIIDAIKMFSTSNEISKYTRIPQRTVRYYLKKLYNNGVIETDEKLNSPARNYRLIDNSANKLGK
jgi:DNA-binding transcriptional ArsR family regulator